MTDQTCDICGVDPTDAYYDHETFYLDVDGINTLVRCCKYNQTWSVSKQLFIPLCVPVGKLTDGLEVAIDSITMSHDGSFDTTGTLEVTTAYTIHDTPCELLCALCATAYCKRKFVFSLLQN